MKRKKQNQIKANNNRFEFKDCLRRTGRAQHVKGLDGMESVKMLHKSAAKEKGLQRVSRAMPTGTWKAQQASRASKVKLAAMNYINRAYDGQ